ncbi:cation transporter [Selenomonas sp. WCA-380-WT-3B 3/]|uniref:Cation transporter n=1 Tax=Selenomonas montiformis TaxID=2652285 RepID=A0A6I2UU89_9FIRM|nr:cation diffusion facilitator family transporter [Selenomonas montiformis]MSV23650.1 cation transporter [Selenomonas montiformis]
MQAKGQNREHIIIRTSVIGIVANLLLAGFKAAVGLSVHSIAVLLDAVNNLSDAMSSIITIVGTRLAARLPDKKHPLGHGRIEYLSALVVAGIVFYAGITSAVESVKKIIEPEAADYSLTSLIILAAAVLVKWLLGRYVRRQGERVQCGALTASGTDALFDAVISLSVLISALLFLATGISLEAYVGVVISVVIIKSGIGMMIETLHEILGQRMDAAFTNRVKEILASLPEVRGAYDLIIYNYGPNKNLASVHLELPDTMSVREVDALTRLAEEKVYRETGVILAGVGVYSYNTRDDAAARLRDDIRKRVLQHDWVVQMHGFYVQEEEKKIRFDVVLNFVIPPQKGLDILYREMREAYPGYCFQIAPDIDASVTA